jgi:anaerobic magnesium-protoporphyrin IX monomethyl ester cyclase
MKTKSTVLLLNPKHINADWYAAEHLGLAYLASTLRKVGHNVLIFDSNLEDLDISKTIEAIVQKMSCIDVVGITATEPETLETGVEVIRKLNNNGYNPHVTVGGYLPSFWAEEVLCKYKEIDSVVIGEGEETLRVLVDAVQNKIPLCDVKGLVVRTDAGIIFHTPVRELITDLDQIPFPARDYLSVSYQKYHHALMYSSRGCYHKCSFCQIAQFYRIAPGGPYRTRSAKNIADEIELLVNKYGIRSIFFVDDEFITKNRHRHKIIKELIHEIKIRNLKFNFSIQYRADTGSNEEILRSLKEVGLSTVFIGVESGVEETLHRFEKGISIRAIKKSLDIIHNLDFNHNIGYILFDPFTTFNELIESIEFLKSEKVPLILKLNGIMILKGTPLEKRVRKENLLIEGDLKLRYIIKDKQVIYFSKYLRNYQKVYENVAKKFYEIHFMIEDLSDNNKAVIKPKIKKVEVKIKMLHIQFLSKAIYNIANGQYSNLEWISEFHASFDDLLDTINSIIDDGMRLIK